MREKVDPVRMTYTATVEVATKHRLDVDEPTSVLADYGPSVGTSSRGWLEIRISVPADNLAQACKTAVAVASAATGAPAIACEVMTESESKDREGIVPEQRAMSAALR